MNKRGEATSLNTNEVIGLVLTFLFIVILITISGKVFFNKGCPAGFDLIEKVEFNPSIASICDEDSEDVLCCSRKSDPLQICKYHREEKELDCDKLAGFNFLKVCSDNTGCGVSTNKCSGGYCEKGICFVKDGIGKCVENFDIDGKRIIVSEDSCEKEFDGSSVGDRCEGARHCIFNEFTRDGKCLGGHFNVGIDDARKECERYCSEAREEVYALNSRYCTARFPVKVENKAEPVEYDCYSRESPIRADCFVQCKHIGQIPQE